MYKHAYYHSNNYTSKKIIKNDIVATILIKEN